MKIHYVSGSRADFGLMRACLQELEARSGTDLSLILTGQALSPRYGDVAGEAAAAGLKVAYKIPAELTGTQGRQMALAFAEQSRRLTEIWSEDAPDLALILGDRGEMLAAAIAAYHLGIPTAHIHGGERSGTLDEGFRHAISKLASIHLPATKDAADRLVRMGESEGSTHVIGAPGLVDLANMAPIENAWLREKFGLISGSTAAVMMFHPVVEERSRAYEQTQAILAALTAADVSALVLRPNSDAGGAEIDRCLEQIGAEECFVVIDHLPRAEFLKAIASADFMIGNSSAGIIESASLGTPCINLGSRQSGRQRNDNTVDCAEFTSAAIDCAIKQALEMNGPFENLYGDGKTDQRLADLLAGLTIGPHLAIKRNQY